MFFCVKICNSIKNTVTYFSIRENFPRVYHEKHGETMEKNMNMTERMSMQETENDIFSDLSELEDAISQYTYLVECASEKREYPENWRKQEYLVPECQVNTWLHVEWKDGRGRFDSDSESLIICGALALLQEIYDDRLPEELQSYQCRLLESENFTRHFTANQLNGLHEIMKQLKVGN